MSERMLTEDEVVKIMKVACKHAEHGGLNTLPADTVMSLCIMATAFLAEVQELPERGGGAGDGGLFNLDDCGLNRGDGLCDGGCA